MTVIIVSFNDGEWLRSCLSSLYDHAGTATLDVVVVDNGSDGAHCLVQAEFPRARAMVCENRGFAHANNRAASSATGRYVLFLNPDTQVVEGRLDRLVAELDARPDLGLTGVRQVAADGTLWPTIRYFPSFSRALGDSLGLERCGGRRPPWAGERELDLSRYGVESDCDWTSGSFMCVRREALLSSGLLDERFFLYSEEPDLCLRLKKAGWKVRHLPVLTIVHHAGKGGMPPRMAAQDVFTRRQYARKHFGLVHRFAYLAAVGLGHALRAATPAKGALPDGRRASWLALRTLLGISEPPFGSPPSTALTAETR